MSTAIANKTEQYLSFNLGDELFALEISKVREVLEYTSVTKVPQTPDFMLGVINLRGGVVPVVDLKLKFGMNWSERTVNTCIIISEVSVEEETVLLGAIADSVDEVFELSPESIEPAPRIGTHLKTDFLNGLGKKNDDFILMLDIDKVFSAHEFAYARLSGEEASENTSVVVG